MIVNRQPFDYAKLCEQMAIWMPCQHPNAIPHKKIKATSGIPYYRIQCPDCGAALSSHLKYLFVEGFRAKGVSIPDWNQDLNDAWYARRRAAYDSIRRFFAWDYDGWWDRYQTYLLSEEWREIRARILQRDGHLCQICKIKDAEQVHHLTYERAGHENDADLLSVCYDCHQSLHRNIAGAANL